MTDLSKLTDDELLAGITPLYILDHRNQQECLDEARRRLAVRDARITELEDALRVSEAQGVREIDHLTKETARRVAAEKVRDEALHKYDAACEAWGYSKARVGALENALHDYGGHLSICDLPTRGAVNGGACDCGWTTTYDALFPRSVLAMRAEESSQ